MGTPRELTITLFPHLNRLLPAVALIFLALSIAEFDARKASMKLFTINAAYARSRHAVKCTHDDDFESIESNSRRVKPKEFKVTERVGELRDGTKDEGSPMRSLLSSNDIPAAIKNFYDPLKIYFKASNISEYKWLLPRNHDMIMHDLIPDIGEKLSRTLSVIRTRYEISRPCEFIGQVRANGKMYDACSISDSRLIGDCIFQSIAEEFITEDIYECGNTTHCTLLKGAGKMNEYNMFLNVLMNSEAECNGSVGVNAMAGFCVTDDTTGRPIYGEVLLCKPVLDMMLIDYKLAVDTIAHEVLHSLGFSSAGFRNFYNRTTGYKCSECGTSTVGNRKYIGTPVSAQFAKEFFNCPSAIGIALEDGGSSGSEGSHVERVNFMDDLMIAVGGVVDGALSNATLAPLHDSGWYKVNFNEAARTLWGYSNESSCELANGICHKKSSGATSKEFCFSDTTSCSHDFKRISTCEFGRTGGVIDQSEMYFKDPSVGGLEMFMNHCPIYSKEELDCSKGISFGRLTASYINLYDDSSRCIEIAGGDHACLKTLCSAENHEFSGIHKSVELIGDQIGPVGTVSVICDASDEGKEKALGTISIVCPNVERVCWNQPCQNMGTPNNYMCVCDFSHFGKYCQHENTKFNQGRYVNSFHYGDFQDITLMAGQYFSIPAYFKGGVSTFKEVTELPVGLSISTDNGTIYGTPSKSSDCTYYTLSAEGFGKDDEARAVIRIRVINNLGFLRDFDPLEPCGKFLYQFSPEKSTHGLTGEVKEYMEYVYAQWESYNNISADQTSLEYYHVSASTRIFNRGSSLLIVVLISSALILGVI